MCVRARTPVVQRLIMHGTTTVGGRYKRRQNGRAVYVPVEPLDFQSERELILSTLKETGRAVRIAVRVATTDSLRTLLDDGCTAIHFTGHGGIDKVGLPRRPCVCMCVLVSK
mgnify:CR=1 FL=1